MNYKIYYTIYNKSGISNAGHCTIEGKHITNEVLDNIEKEILETSPITNTEDSVVIIHSMIKLEE